MSASKVTISLPSELLDAADRAREARHYTRSELFREALRLYLLPPFEPTAAERRAMDDGLAEIDKGDWINLGDLERL